MGPLAAISQGNHPIKMQLLLGSLKFTFHTFLKVTFVSCFFAKKIQSSEDMGSSPVRLAGEVVSARQEVLQVQEVAAKKNATGINEKNKPA